MATTVKKPPAKSAKTGATPTSRKGSARKAPAASKATVAKAASGDRPAKAAKAKDEKAKKPKLVRDSFTIPKAEYAVLEALKMRAAKSGAPAKKSELLRAGIKALSGMAEPAFLAALGAVPAIKTGRPAKA